MTRMLEPDTDNDTEATTVAAAEPTAHRTLPVVPVRMADLAVVGAAAGALALLEVPPLLRAIGVTVFIAVGPGAAILTWVRIPRRLLVSTIPVLGMAVVTLVAITAMWSYRWVPLDILLLQVVGVAASSAYWYYQNRTTPLTARQGWHRRRIATVAGESVVRRHLSLALSVLAVVIWAVALPGLPGLDAGYYGLLFSGTGPWLAVAIVLCAWALLVAVRNRQLVPAAVSVLAAIVVARVTTFAATEVPLYDWTYKHLAVVDYIMVNGRIAPDGTDIYTQWPAFFVTWAWFSDVTGMPPIDVAHVFAPAIHVLIALTVYAAARVLGQSRRVAITAAFIAEIVNWVAQDYFSPQAWTLVLAFGMLVLLLASRTSRACGVLAIVVFTATVPTHQLTPFWAVGTAVLLVLFRRAGPWWVAVSMTAIAAAYLLLNLEAVLPYGLLSGGSPVSNAASNILTSGVPAKDFTSAVVRTFSAVVVLTAAACAVWRWRQKKPVLAIAIVAFSSFGLLFGQNYGGEAIFRVFLYSSLGCALLMAPALVAIVDEAARSVRRRVVAAVAAIGVTGAALAGLHGYVALWPMVYETRAQVDVMNAITKDADLRTRLVMLRLGGMPTRLNADYADLTLFNPYFDEPVAYDLWHGLDPRLPELKAAFPSEDDIRILNENATKDAYQAYVIFSEQSTKAVRYYGDYRPEAVDLLQNALRESPNWALYYQDGATVIFRSINEANAPGVRGG